MAKKSLIEDYLTKLSNVFKKDVYILDNTFCLGGVESEDELVTQIVCQNNFEVIQQLNELFPDTKCIFIKNIKKDKNDIINTANTKITESEIILLNERKEKVLNLVNKFDSWETFKFTEEESISIFDNGMTYILFENDDIPSTTISKSLFPMTKSKTANNIYYNIELSNEKTEVVKLITTFDTDYFQIYNLIQYLDI